MVFFEGRRHITSRLHHSLPGGEQRETATPHVSEAMLPTEVSAGEHPSGPVSDRRHMLLEEAEGTKVVHELEEATTASAAPAQKQSQAASRRPRFLLEEAADELKAVGKLAAQRGDEAYSLAVEQMGSVTRICFDIFFLVAIGIALLFFAFVSPR